MKLAGRLVVAAILLIGFGAVLSRPARALPVFAHRYGFSCQQCHSTIPQLNQFGEQFRRNGFRLTSGRGVFPVATKVNLAYTSAASGDDANGGNDAGLPKAVVDEVELISAGSLSNNAHFWLEQYVVDGGQLGRPRDMWLQFDRATHVFTDGTPDNLGTTWHARVGEFTLPLPTDPETQRPTESHYELYDQAVGSNAFAFFDPRVGADLFVTNDRTGIEAHFIAMQAHDRMSGIASSGTDFMGELQKTFGDWTVYAYRYQGQRHTLPQFDFFYRQGYGVAYEHGHLSTAAVLQHGNNTSADGLGSSASSSGGFIQAAWAFTSALQLVSRYDDITDAINGRETQGVLSLVVRPRRNMRFTMEAARTPGRTTQFNTGLMFAY